MDIVITNKYNFNSKDIIIGDSDRALNINTINHIRKIIQLDNIKSINEYFSILYDSLNKQKIDWVKFLPLSKRNEYSLYLKNILKETEKYITKYFYNEFPKRLSLFRLIYDLDTNNPTIYKHSNVTGRLSVEKGINYLTMKKDERNKLLSPFKDNKIFEIDFKSCEPTLYMRHFNLVDDSVEDIYTYIANCIDISVADRPKLKRIILSILYGANERSVSKYSNISIKKIKKIKSILNVVEFESILRKEYNDKGFIENLYGRPILSDSNLVNYWIQSSAVDYCCLSFYNFFKENKNFKLHAVIHDAALFSVHVDNIDKLDDINYLKYKNLSIPVKINPIESDI